MQSESDGQSRFETTRGSVDAGSSHGGALATLRALIVAVSGAVQSPPTWPEDSALRPWSPALVDSSTVNLRWACLMIAPAGTSTSWKRMPTYWPPPWPHCEGGIGT